MSLGSFIWGQGGRRMTPEDITAERRIAAQLMQPDYSPIQSPWQGLARVAGNIVGGLDERRAGRAADANARDSASVLQALMNPGGAQAVPPVAAPTRAPMDPAAATEAGPGLGAPSAAPGAPVAAPAGAPPVSQHAINPAVIQAMTSPYVSDEVRALATMQYRQGLEAANRRPAEPHYWETNNGSLGVIDPETNQPRIVYQDPTPRVQWIPVQNPDGTRTLVPMMPGGQAPWQGAGAPGGPPATLPPDFDFDQGGPQATRPAATFPRGGAPVANAASIIRELIPQARITSTHRDPNSALGRANPRSWHNRTNAAIDVAPVHGMSFSDYVNRIRGAGYRIIESRDEQAHPLAWTTGPNWHVVIGH